MAKRLVVFAGQNTTEPVAWRLVDDRIGEVQHGECMLEDLPKITSECWLVLPGDKVVSLLETVSARSDKKLRAAIPYAIEDDVASELENIHIAFGDAVGNSALKLIQIVDHIYLSDWIDAVQSSGKTVNAALADHSLLTSGSLEPIQLRLHDRTLVACGPWSASVDANVEEILIPPLIKEVMSNLQSDLDSTTVVPAISQLSVEDPYSYIARNVSETGLSFLQGEFENRNVSYSSAFEARKWRLPAALALVTALILIGTNTLEGVSLRREVDNTRLETEALFRSAFPGVKRVVNPRAQLKSQLGLSRGSGSEFLALSSILTNALESNESVDIQSIRFDSQQSELQASVSFSSYSDITELKESIVALGGQAEEGGSRQSAGRRLGEITVKRQ